MTLLDFSTKSRKSSEAVTALSSSSVNGRVGYLGSVESTSETCFWAALSSSSISLLRFWRNSSSRSRSLLLRRFSFLGERDGEWELSDSEPEWASKDRLRLGGDPFSDVWIALLYEMTSGACCAVGMNS